MSIAHDGDTNPYTHRDDCECRDCMEDPDHVRADPGCECSMCNEPAAEEREYGDEDWVDPAEGLRGAA